MIKTNLTGQKKHESNLTIEKIVEIVNINLCDCNFTENNLNRKKIRGY